MLSAVSPAVAHLQLHDLRASGTVVGRLSAWATAGAPIGTFGAGFVLVPLMPVSSAVLMIGGVLVLARFALEHHLAGALVGRRGRDRDRGDRDLAGCPPRCHSPCTVETAYNCIVIEADAAQPGGYDLILDGGHSSYVGAQGPDRASSTPMRAGSPTGSTRMRPSQGATRCRLRSAWRPRSRVARRDAPGSRSEVLELDAELVDSTTTG